MIEPCNVREIEPIGVSKRGVSVAAVEKFTAKTKAQIGMLAEIRNCLDIQPGTISSRMPRA